jgi:predicted nucleic acid-binding Zn ribbon protein
MDIKVMHCILCNNILTGKQTKFCSKRCKNLLYQKTIRVKFKEKIGISIQSIKGLKLKLLFIYELGGCCSICGYNKNISALEFHHKNPNDKLFNLDSRTFSNRNIEIIKIEINKCILICSNCHQEIHNPHLNFDNINLIS